tara:strand:- start:538 stop:669 length:132 start_codon:yes stop_codon:yes gene_type:complete
LVVVEQDTAVQPLLLHKKERQETLQYFQQLHQQQVVAVDNQMQ